MHAWAHALYQYPVEYYVLVYDPQRYAGDALESSWAVEQFINTHKLDGSGTCTEFESKARQASIKLLDAIFRSESQRNGKEVAAILGELSVLFHDWDEMLSAKRFLHGKECIVRRVIIEKSLQIIAGMWRLLLDMKAPRLSCT